MHLTSTIIYLEVLKFIMKIQNFKYMLHNIIPKDKLNQSRLKTEYFMEVESILK